MNIWWIVVDRCVHSLHTHMAQLNRFRYQFESNPTMKPRIAELWWLIGRGWHVFEWNARTTTAMWIIMITQSSTARNNQQLSIVCRQWHDSRAKLRVSSKSSFDWNVIEIAESGWKSCSKSIRKHKRRFLLTLAVLAFIFGWKCKVGSRINQAEGSFGSPWQLGCVNKSAE